MRTRPRDVDSPIWAITCYFNTSDSPRRLQNFRGFRERLGIPLVAIELSFDGEFELGESDAEILLRRTSRDELWHKERLLNLALDAVPEHCAAIAWIDADVLFENESWHEEALVALETTPFLQPYDRYHDLPEAGDRLEDAFASGTSFAAAVMRSADGKVRLQDVRARERGGSYNVGLVWVARAELIRRHRLYDAFILGSGDRGRNTSLAVARPRHASGRIRRKVPRSSRGEAARPAVLILA